MRNLGNSNAHAQALREQHWEACGYSPVVQLTVGSPTITTPASVPVPRPVNASRTGPSKSSEIIPEKYAQPFLDFINQNPTVFHAVGFFASQLESAGYTKLSERDSWSSKLKRGGKYYTTRNGSALMAFTIPTGYAPGNGAAIVVGHIDALTAKLKPVSKKPDSHGYVQLGVAPYAGALNSTWWDRDLGVGGRVIVKNSQGKIESKLVKLDYPIARIPTLAPHFGIGGPFNKETQMVPIIGLESPEDKDSGFPEGSFARTQPPRLVKAIAKELGVPCSSIINWELELFDTQPGQLGGLSKELLFAPRIDDKLCSYSALKALIYATSSKEDLTGSTINLVGLFDDEEIGSKLRQGAASNLMSSVIERVIDSFSESGKAGANLVSQTYANSFMISADVTHAVNPNFLNAYLTDHMPQLNVGLTIGADSNGHLTTDAVSTAFLTRVAEKSGNKLQVFQIRNDTRSGGTVGPMLSSVTGIRSIDAGLAQLSMHSIRATCGSKDPGLGVKIFAAFFEYFEEVDKEFAE